jgi:hypothetical protein
MRAAGGQDPAGSSISGSTSGLPSVEGSWRTRAERGRGHIDAEAADAISPEAEIGIGWIERHTWIERIDLREARQTFTWPLSTAPESIVFDPNVTLLAEFKPLARQQ